MFVFSPAKLERNVSLWKKCLPSIKPYYAMKCNPHPSIITKLSQLKVNFECAAVSEISSCLSTTNDIIYGHPHKTIDQIQYAKTNKNGFNSTDRTEQFLGLLPSKPPYSTNQNKLFVEMWVKPEDIDRPCLDGEILGSE